MLIESGGRGRREEGWGGQLYKRQKAIHGYIIESSASHSSVNGHVLLYIKADLKVTGYLTIYAWVYFGVQISIPLVHMPMFILFPYGFEYYNFIAWFEFRK